MLTCNPKQLPMAAALSTLPGLAMTVDEVSPDTLKVISIPDKVETNFGTLEFFDGVPTDATADKLYDNLDRIRAVQVFLDNVGAVSMYSVRKGLAAFVWVRCKRRKHW